MVKLMPAFSLTFLQSEQPEKSGNCQAIFGTHPWKSAHCGLAVRVRIAPELEFEQSELYQKICGDMSHPEAKCDQA